MNTFKKEGIYSTNENDGYVSTQIYLQNELKDIDNGKSKFININQLDNELETTIISYED